MLLFPERVNYDTNAALKQAESMMKGVFVTLMAQGRQAEDRWAVSYLQVVDSCVDCMHHNTRSEFLACKCLELITA